MDQHAHPLPGAPTVDRISSAVIRGASHEGRLIGGGARNQEPDGDTRCGDNDLDRFGPSDRRNTLCPVSLVYCIDVYDPYDLDDLDGFSPEGDPCLSLYSLEEEGYK